MDTGTSGLSASDVALLNNNDGWGNNSWIWIFCLFFLFFGFGGNGWNGNNQQNMQDAIAAGNGGYVTNSQMNDALKFQSLQEGSKDIIASVEQSKYDTANTLAAIESRIAGQEANILALGNTIAEKQNTCCQQALRGIDGVNYNAAQNTASINENTTAQVQKVLDAIQQNKIDTLQAQVNQLQLQNATNGVLRYPNGFNYSMPNPFCNCGSGCGCNV